MFLSLHIVAPEIPGEKFNEEDVFTVKGDWDYLSRLFTNLIANAIEHTNNVNHAVDSGEAAVTVELALIKSVIKTMRVRETPSQLQLEVKVKDNGTGISASSLPHIFDRFYRGDPARSTQREIATPTGAGLGLAIAKAIVENHQGEIKVESILEQGTTFTITLPQSLDF